MKGLIEGDKIFERTFIEEVKRKNNCRMIIVKCSCGKICERNRRDILLGRSKSCGHGNYNGENNPNWKGGLRNKSNSIRKSKRYIDWRNKCFERDDYTCQISGQKGGELVVHHLSPFRLLIDDINNENSIIWDIYNGITISKELHIKFHSIYGVKKFTEENFNKFKESLR